MTMAIPVTVIGGYLGAGKTTLVNHALRNAGGRRLAVLVNEFGDLPIDGDLIEAEDDNLITISGGCVCCSFGADLDAALARLSALDPRPDHLLIEASGVAIPTAIALTVSMGAEVEIDGLVVLADAGQIRTQAADSRLGATIMQQLAEAQIIFLTKTDLVDPNTLAHVTQWISGHAPMAQVLPIVQGQVPVEMLVGLPAPRLVTSPAGHADGAFETMVLTPQTPLNPAALAEALAQGPYGVVRAKGFVTDRDGLRMLVQTVGPQWDVKRASDTASDGVVVIGLKGTLDRAGLNALI